MLDMFFKPSSVAVIGASENPKKLGNQIMVNIIDGYKGEIYPINPTSKEILGHKCYPSILDVPGEVEQAIIVVPAAASVVVMEQCGQKGVKGVIVITAGFREAGEEGKKLEDQLLEIAKKYGMRVVGPNCLGLIDMWTPVNSSFANNSTPAGPIAFTSQSGALGAAVLDYALTAKIDFSHFVSLGNKADVDEVSLFEAWADNPNTKVIMAYIEGLRNGPAFIKAARETAAKKPIIAVKSGRTASGSKAVSSHTGSLAGSDAAYDAAFAQSGVLRASSVQELFDYGIAFAYQPLIQGNRICIVTNAGGPGVMATDALEPNGLVLANLDQSTVDALAPVLPAAANIHNPVDVLGDADAKRYGIALDIVLKDPNIDGIIVILTPQSSTEVKETAEIVIERSKSANKPIVACFIGGEVTSQGVEALTTAHVPTYPFPERAIAALGAMYRYYSWLNEPQSKVESFAVDKAAVADLFAKIRADGRNTIGDSEAQAILKAYGITTPRSSVAATTEEAVKYCEEIGYPVVMKIASPDILHKSDVGGLKVGIKNADEVREWFKTIIDRAKAAMPNATIWGVQIQEMVQGAREIIIGMNNDPQFGPLIMFGLGGIYVEVLKDVTFRVAPMTRLQAQQMIQSIRSYKLLTGVRGQAAADIDAATEVVLKVSQLVTDFPEIAELDINPLLVREQGKGAVAVDMRLILK
ncbi:MAG: acetate--CoA ligase family protein [Chloroflexi bacterium]|mgnify:CR=1 FL=1|nr:acetate--CoA ligase family protein [Chloroflexota bacterium]